MSLSSLLLRLVLCVALVANGIGTSVAGVRMHSGGAGMAAMRAPVAEHCHEESTPAAAAKVPTVHAHPGKHAGACCHAGACACQCLQQAQLAVPSALSVQPQILHDAVAHVPAATREPPRLPHLIRPPIAPAC